MFFGLHYQIQSNLRIKNVVNYLAPFIIPDSLMTSRYKVGSWQLAVGTDN